MKPGEQNTYLIILILIFCTLVILFFLLNRDLLRKKQKKRSAGASPEIKRFRYSLIFPSFLLFCMWFIKFIELSLQTDFGRFGILPGEIKGITGVVFAPLIHDDFNHLIDNSLPVFFLSLALFYFYRDLAYLIFPMIYIGTGFLVWLTGRDAYHIGASGLVYGLASFLFFSGIARANPGLLAISLLVTFFYGGMIWGLLPYDYHVSWESHLMGGIMGFVLSIVYHNKGPVRKKYSWEEEEEEENTPEISAHDQKRK